MGANKLTLELLTTFTVSNSLMANNNDRYSELLNTQLKTNRHVSINVPILVISGNLRCGPSQAQAHTRTTVFLTLVDKEYSLLKWALFQLLAGEGVSTKDGHMTVFYVVQHFFLALRKSQSLIQGIC